MDDDAILREIVKRTLEGKGVLSQIRASLRAAVFTCLDEQEQASGVYVPNPTALNVKRDSAGLLALQVVVDFLKHFELVKTLSVLKTETNMGEGDVLPRVDLVSILGTGGGKGGPSCDKDSPAIMQLIARKCHSDSVIEGETLPPEASLSKRTDTMRSTGVTTRVKNEGPSREHTLSDVRAYDFVEQARSSAAQFNPLATPTTTIAEGESGGKGEGVYVDESVNSSEEQSRTNVVECNWSESSAGDNEEGVHNTQMNEDTMHSMEVKNEDPSREYARGDVRANDVVGQARTIADGENGWKGECVDMDESVNSSEEQSRSDVGECNWSKSSAGDNEEGVHSTQMNEDTMRSTEVKNEDPSREYALGDVKANDIVEQARTIANGENGWKVGGVDMNESANGSKERARSDAVECNWSESSAGDNEEGVHSTQMNEDTMRSTEVKNEDPSREYALGDVKANDIVEQARTIANGENGWKVGGVDMNESANGSKERARSDAVECNWSESSAGDNEEGVHSTQMNEDTMRSTEVKNEDPSREYALGDVRANDVVGQARTIADGENGWKGGGVDMNESANGSKERARSDAVECNWSESSAGDNEEGVHSTQMNEDTMRSTEVKNEDPSREYALGDVRANDVVGQARTIADGENGWKGGGVDMNESANGSKERARSDAVECNWSESSAGDNEEGVHSTQMNEDTMRSTEVKNEDPSREYALGDVRANDVVGQARTIADGENGWKGGGVDMNESANGSKERARSDAVECNWSESSAGDNEEGVHSTQMNEDTMRSTEVKNEDPSREYALGDVREYDFVEQARTIAEGENGWKVEGMDMDKSVNSSAEQSRSDVGECNWSESSAGDNEEGVHSTQMNEDTMRSTEVKNEDPSREYALGDVRANDVVGQARTIADGENGWKGGGVDMNESANGSKERARSDAVECNWSESSDGDNEEGVHSTQMNEDTMRSTEVKNEDPSREYALGDVRANDVVGQARTIADGENGWKGGGVDMNESANGSKERARSDAVVCNWSESSAGDNEEGVHSTQMNEDTMRSTEVKNEDPSREYALGDVREYDFVEQARTIAEGENGWKVEGMDMDKSVNSSAEQSRSDVGECNWSESSAGDNEEGVHSTQMNEDTMRLTGVKNEDPSREHALGDVRAYDFVEQARSSTAQSNPLATPARSMVEGESGGKGEGVDVDMNESANGSKERARSDAVECNWSESSAGDNEEGVYSTRMNEGHGTASVTSTATGAASRLYESGPLAESSPTQHVAYSGLRIGFDRLCRGDREPVAEAPNGDVDFGHYGGIRASPEDDDSGKEDSASETAELDSARLGADETREDGECVSSVDSDVEVPAKVLGTDDGLENYEDEEWDESENYEDDAFEVDETDEADAAVMEGEQYHRDGDLASDGGLEVQGGRHPIMEGEHSADEVLFDAALSEVSDQDRGRKADANWEFMVGLSADSSFSVGDRRTLDDQGFDFEDAQSV